jgi:uncharacterized Zn-finger protein
VLIDQTQKLLSLSIARLSLSILFFFSLSHSHLLSLTDFFKHNLQMKTFMVHDKFFFFFFSLATPTTTLGHSWAWIRSIHYRHTTKHKSPKIKNPPIINRLFILIYKKKKTILFVNSAWCSGSSTLRGGDGRGCVWPQ